MKNDTQTSDGRDRDNLVQKNTRKKKVLSMRFANKKVSEKTPYQKSLLREGWY
jgi:hypothetical protein